MIKLIVSDIDGTLVSDGTSRINPEVFDVIMRLKREKGIHFAAASGRQAASIEYTFGPIQKEIFYLAENGAYLGCYGRNLFLHPMDQKAAGVLIEDIRKNPKLEVHRWVKNGYHYDVEMVDDVTKTGDPIIKVAAFRKEGIQDAVRELVERHGSTFKMSISGNEWMDCMAPEINKGAAVRTLQESLGIAPEETMAFGDQMNDIEMLGRAYYSFAVGNARAEVKKAARFQADRNVNDGVLKVLKLLL